MRAVLLTMLGRYLCNAHFLSLSLRRRHIALNEIAVGVRKPSEKALSQEEHLTVVFHGIEREAAIGTEGIILCNTSDKNQ